MGKTPADGKSATESIFTQPLPTPQEPKPEVKADPIHPPMPQTPRLEIALGITGKFEGKGFSQVTGDFDGMGLSVGILQWNFGKGSLQARILRKFIVKHGSVDELKVFPLPIDHLSTASVAPALKWCRANMLSGKDVKPDWKKAWEKFLSRPEMIAIQLDNCKGVGESADKMMKSLGLDSLRAYCWCFDIATQNGSMQDVALASPDRKEAYRVLDAITTNSNGGKDTVKNKPLWRSMIEKVSDEQISLFITSHRRALLSRSEYYCDVLNRKGTIAMGEGYVHGALVRLPTISGKEIPRILG